MYLHDQIQIPFQTGSVAHNDTGIWIPKTEEIPRSLFFGRMSHQRIGTRKIYQKIRFPVKGKAS